MDVTARWLNRCLGHPQGFVLQCAAAALGQNAKGPTGVMLAWHIGGVAAVSQFFVCGDSLIIDQPLDCP
ncbi:hypothetical protein AAV94_12930 [Lampropedia cohaerens]|uniref:Uncharacterized protein n=1 Tax=Lampropedia cohaerens TaxID=1610491 RepID=A0A0U1PWQ5_9BURK|nr:hypothetical protein AAV94_12930 [Lampropedia cohaerens]